MRTSLLSVCILAVSLANFSTDSVNADEVSDRINKNWDYIDKHYNVNKEWQKPGEIQKPGEFQVLRGIKAIKQKTEDCNHRFTVGADTLFEFDKAAEARRIKAETLPDRGYDQDLGEAGAADGAGAEAAE